MTLSRLRMSERQVLMFLLGASVLGYLAAIIWSSLFYGQTKKLAPGGEAKVRWMRAGTADRTREMRYLLAEYFDPSLLSLPSWHGFSRSLWGQGVKPPPTVLAPERLAAYLAAPIQHPIPVLLMPVSTATAVLDSLGAVEWTPPVEGTGSTVAPPASVTNSVLHIAGDLGGRALLARPPLPLATGDSPVRRTRVLIAVAADGLVQHAALERSSGNDAQDQQALELSRQLRFAPVAAVDPLALTWGTAVFVWASSTAK